MLRRLRLTLVGDSLGLAFVTLLVGLIGLTLSTAWDALPVEARSDAAWRALLFDSGIQQATLRSLALALLATGLAGAVAVPLALVAANGRSVSRVSVLALGLLPLAMPPFVGAPVLAGMAAAAVAVPASSPPAGGSAFPLLVVTHALHALPVLLLSLVVGIARVDRTLAESARTHGIPDLTAWFRITLPLVAPPFALAIAFVALRILDDVGAPLALGRTDLLAPMLLRELGDDGLSARGAQLATLLVLLHAVVVALAWPFLLGPRPPVAPLQPGDGTPRLAALVALLCVGVLSLAPPIWLAVQADLPQGAAAIVGQWAATADGLAPLAVTAAVMATLGLATAILTRRPGAIGGLVRLTVAALLTFPGLLVAIGLGGFALQHPGIGASAYWPAAVIALAVAMPVLPLIPHLTAHVGLGTDRDVADLAGGMGAAAGWLSLRPWLPGVFLVAAALASLGVALGLAEIGAVQALLTHTRPTPGLEVLGRATAAPSPAEWATGGTLLTAVMAVLLAAIALLLYPRGAAGLRQRRGEKA